MKVKQQGFILLMVLVIITTLFLIVTAWLGSTIAKNNLFNSQFLSAKSYYLAEGAIQDALFEISHNQDLWDGFTTSGDWQATFEKDNVFSEGQSWQVKIQNTDLGQADVFATSTIKISNKNYRKAIAAKITATEDEERSIILNYD